MMKPNLEYCIQNIYKEFQKYTVKGNLRERSCTCCVTNEEIRALLLKGLNELTYDDIYHFMTSAVSTFGDIEDYKHFLPRILELMQESNSGIIDDFLTFEHLDYCKWKTWDAKEVELIENYFYVLFENTLLQPEISVYDFEQKLTLFSKYSKLEDALKIWDVTFTDKADRLIVQYVLNDSTISLNKEKMRMLRDWLYAENKLNRLERLFLKCDNKIEADRISIAYTIVENNRKC